MTPLMEPIIGEELESALNSAPFLNLPGALNPRDVASLCGQHLRPRLLYRTGLLDPNILQAADLERHNIKRIFDLRGVEDRAKFPDPHIDGVENVWLPSTAPMMTVDPTLFGERNVSGVGFLKLYEGILEVHTPSFRAVMEHVRDRPEDGLLFHCSAGKDRTGVLAALLQMLAAVPPTNIAADYTVTRIGIEPARTRLLAMLSKSGTGVSVERPGTLAIGSVHPQTMFAFVELVENRWGSAEGYCEKMLGLQPEDISRIKSNLRPI
ncbi:hypothetical protein P152DRAFT_421853 [Eremomyces bilateralis CBS 781.70]|uniref:Tyrosine specific protein phosphatases domain-containing protein n=1 Tax=Eremomyces bilateralis CBS 781.70 TaxID=1392243 RepID=A0A6G1FVY6_9PEZI|nr:uncharacterized protein P152DRAFT_421853 [Eremomyces bilateralis CBS 781.70]KAF1809866.1 hypothetical protein P152DRAFT_421853 [Eremomyces bilateralis CBS 781.70]